MDNYFENPFKLVSISDQVTNPNIVAGAYSYYAGYYHGHSFDDCAHFLSFERRNVDKLYIGKFCAIGSGAVFIMGGNQGHNNGWATAFPFTMFDDFKGVNNAPKAFKRSGDTIIGNDVWIGEEALIMPGVVVGDGAIIGARAVVTRDVEPYSVVVGNPARHIHYRFNDEQIANLMEMQWWDWPVDVIKQELPLICSKDIAALYQKWMSRNSY